MHTRFLLVRHAACAQTESVLLGRAVDVPLDARGERQASIVAERLRRERPLRIETSPRLRAQQTARAVAAATDRQPHACAALDEIDFGAWSGRRFDELAGDPDWQRWNGDRDHACTPAGDSIARAQDRLVQHLRVLARRFAGASLVLVTHAEIIRCAVLHALSAAPRDYLRIDVPPASLTVLHARGDRLHVEAGDRPRP